jgi:hypothetical protein
MKQWDDIIHTKKREHRLDKKESYISYLVLDEEDWRDFRQFLQTTTLLPSDYSGEVNFMGVTIKPVDNQ